MVGSKLDKFGGGIIGKRKGSGELDGDNLEWMRSILSLKNWRNEMASDCGTLLSRLDSVMRVAARLILQLQYRDHVTTLIRDRLHWLDAALRITYKLYTRLLLSKQSNSAIPHWTLHPGRNRSGSIETSVCSGGWTLHSTMSHRDAWPSGFCRLRLLLMELPTSGNLELALQPSKSCSRLFCSDKCRWVGSF